MGEMKTYKHSQLKAETPERSIYYIHTQQFSHAHTHTQSSPSADSPVDLVSGAEALLVPLGSLREL